MFDCFSDVQFQVDNGVVNAHRSLMMARCDMMQSMFSYNFREAGAKKVCLQHLDYDSIHDNTNVLRSY